jgi:hypothetical protein
MRSFIVRIYRRRRDGELTGTVQAVGDEGQPAAAFASGLELLQQMALPPRPKGGPAPGAAAGEPPPGDRVEGLLGER